MRSSRLADGSPDGESRVPHQHRRGRQRAVAPHAGAPRPALAGAADRVERDRRVLPDGRRCHRDDARPAGAAGRVAGAVRARTAHALRRRRACVRGSGPEARVARVRRRCAGRRRVGALHQPSEADRRGGVQPGTLRSVRSRPRRRARHRNRGRGARAGGDGRTRIPDPPDESEQCRADRPRGPVRRLPRQGSFTAGRCRRQWWFHRSLRRGGHHRRRAGHTGHAERVRRREPREDAAR